MIPCSIVIFTYPSIPSSAATLATPSGIPNPRLITLPLLSSMAALLATTLRWSKGMGTMLSTSILTSPVSAGSYSPSIVCICPGWTTTASTRIPGIRTFLGSREPALAAYFTWQITMPPQLCTAWAMASASR